MADIELKNINGYTQTGKKALAIDGGGLVFTDLGGAPEFAKADLPTTPDSPYFAKLLDDIRGLMKRVYTDSTKTAVEYISANNEIDARDFFANPSNADNATPLQNAVNFAATKGVAKVKIPEGVYNVSKFTMPFYPGESPNGQQIIEVVGAAPPSTMHGTLGTNYLSNKGTIIKSNAAGNDGIITQASNSGFSLVNNIFRNLTVRAYNNPNICAFDMRNASQVMFEDVMIDTGVYNVNASEPTHANAIGIITPIINNGAITDLRKVLVSGFYSGIFVNEHTNGDQINLSSCKEGLNFREGYFDSKFGRVLGTRNQKNIVVAGNHTFDIGTLAVEHVGANQFDSNNAWQQTIQDVDDPSNLGRGTIGYHCVIGGLGLDNSKFLINGAGGLDIDPIGTTLAERACARLGVAAQTVPGGGVNPINLGTTPQTHNSNLLHPITQANTIYLKRRGFYSVNAVIQCPAGAAGTITAELRKNGNEIFGKTIVQMNASGTVTIIVRGTVVLAESQFINLFLGHNAVNMTLDGAFSFMEIKRLGSYTQ